MSKAEQIVLARNKVCRGVRDKGTITFAATPGSFY